METSIPPFFSTAAIEYWASLAESRYDPNDPQLKEKLNWIKANIVPQLGYWAESVKLRFPGFIVDGRKDALNRDRSSFRHYLWLRLFPVDYHPLLYFTLSVDYKANGNVPGLVMKIDFRRESKDLNKQQKDFLEKQLQRENDGVSWTAFTNFESSNWEDLINTTVVFIQTYQKRYDFLLNKVRDLQNAWRISRITWNNNGWIQPSGWEGKSKSKDTHESKYGYGHEEWLGDRSKVIDGVQYSFLEPLNKGNAKYESETFNILRYTIDDVTKKRFWAGQIYNARVLTADESDKIKREYIKRGWFGKMLGQMMRLKQTQKALHAERAVTLSTSVSTLQIAALPPWKRFQENILYTKFSGTFF